MGKVIKKDSTFPSISIQAMDWDETLVVSIYWVENGKEYGKAGYIDLSLAKTTAPEFYKEEVAVDIVKKMLGELIDIYVEAKTNG